MTEPATLNLAIPPRYLPEATIVSMLIARHTRISMNAHRYAFADHVPSQPWGAARICDFMAVDCYGTYGRGPQNPIHGFEIKSSRSDWLAELRQPGKAEAFRPYCDYWWLVVSDLRIVHDGELPDGWGLLGVQGSVLRAAKRAPSTTPAAMPRPMLAALARAIAKTARRIEASR